MEESKSAVCWEAAGTKRVRRCSRGDVEKRVKGNVNWRKKMRRKGERCFGFKRAASVVYEKKPECLTVDLRVVVATDNMVVTTEP